MNRSFTWFVVHLFVGSSLVDMYAKCRSMEEVWKVFNKMSL
jgi:pentatricopeptide repeat protein